MGLFDWRKKKKNSDTTFEIETAKARVEAINNGDVDLESAYEETMSYLAKQDADREKHIKETSLFNDEIASRVAQLNNAPGARRANAVVQGMARELKGKFVEPESEEQRKVAEDQKEKIREFNEKYYDITNFYNALRNGKVNNPMWEKLPADVRNFTFLSYLTEKTFCGIADEFDKNFLAVINNTTSKYTDIGKKHLMSLGVLNYLGLLDINDVYSYENPTKFEGVVKTVELSDTTYAFDGDVDSLGAIISSIAMAIGKKQGLNNIGVVDDFFMGRIPIIKVQTTTGTMTK